MTNFDESVKAMKIIHRERQIERLKKKIEALKKELAELKTKGE